MGRATWMQTMSLVAALALSSATATTALAPRALAAPADDLASARTLIDEARPWVKKADNAGLPAAERKRARQEAFGRLKQARGLFDSYIDTHPAETESLDSEYCECASMLYWVKKMASINEFDADTPVELPKDDDKRAAGGDDPGGKGAATDPTPPTAGDESAPARPPEPDARDLMAERARRALAYIQDIATKSPGDVPHLHALYERFLCDFPDPSLPEYTTAALRLGALSDRMKTVFKEQVGSDPDALDNADSDEITQVVGSLAKLLRSGEADERARAAKLLGSCGSGAASYHLAKALRDDDDAVATAARDGLIGLGGTRAADQLTKLYRDGKQDAQIGALEVLEGIAKKGSVDARTVSFYLGRFVLSNDQDVAGRALDFLAALGPPARDGLVEALTSKNAYKKMEVMQALAKAQCYDAAFHVGAYLLQGDGAKTVAYRNAATTALTTMGKPAVPYLLSLLTDRRVRLGTAAVMRQITGTNYSASDQKEWRDWCRENGLELPD